MTQLASFRVATKTAANVTVSAEGCEIVEAVGGSPVVAALHGGDNTVELIPGDYIVTGPIGTTVSFMPELHQNSWKDGVRTIRRTLDTRLYLGATEHD